MFLENGSTSKIAIDISKISLNKITSQMNRFRRRLLQSTHGRGHEFPDHCFEGENISHYKYDDWQGTGKHKLTLENLDCRYTALEIGCLVLALLALMICCCLLRECFRTGKGYHEEGCEVDEDDQSREVELSGEQKDGGWRADGGALTDISVIPRN